MKELIQILEVAASKYGSLEPLTIGHLLNICKMAERMKDKNLERQADLEDKQHWEIMNEINPFGQD